MSKKTKMWLVIATFLVFIGVTILFGVMSMLKWDFSKLSTVKHETNNHDIHEEYENIIINTHTADIELILSEDAKTSVLCYEQENIKHSVAVKENNLIVDVVDTRKWYDYIGINLGTPRITLFLPKNEYGNLSVKSSTGDIAIPNNFIFKNIDISESTGDVANYASVSESLKIKTSTGNIHTENISANTVFLSASTGRITASNLKCEGDISIKVSTGKITVNNVECKNLLSTGSTGTIFLENVIASEKFSIKRSTGDVSFEDCDADEIFVETDTGNVKGNFLSDKVFITETDTGKIDVPKTTSGGKCEIKTDTGNIKFK